MTTYSTSIYRCNKCEGLLKHFGLSSYSCFGGFGGGINLDGSSTCFIETYSPHFYECPHCKSYIKFDDCEYLASQQDYGYGEEDKEFKKYSKDALTPNPLSNDEIIDKGLCSKEEEKSLRIESWWMVNSFNIEEIPYRGRRVINCSYIFHRGEEHIIKRFLDKELSSYEFVNDERKDHFEKKLEELELKSQYQKWKRENLAKLIDMFDEGVIDEAIMKANAHRELCEYDKCIDLIEKIRGRIEENSYGELVLGYIHLFAFLRNSGTFKISLNSEDKEVYFYKVLISKIRPEDLKKVDK